MSFIRSVFLALSVIFLTVPSGAADPDFIVREEAAIGALGRLNATALMCKDVESVRRIKKVIIYGVPKVREYGETFEEATNAAFLDFSRQGIACPTPAAMSADIDKAEAHMTEVFADYAQ